MDRRLHAAVFPQHRMLRSLLLLYMKGLFDGKVQWQFPDLSSNFSYSVGILQKVFMLWEGEIKFSHTTQYLFSIPHKIKILKLMLPLLTGWLIFSSRFFFYFSPFMFMLKNISPVISAESFAAVKCRDSFLLVSWQPWQLQCCSCFRLQEKPEDRKQA